MQLDHHGTRGMANNMTLLLDLDGLVVVRVEWLVNGTGQCSHVRQRRVGLPAVRGYAFRSNGPEF
jgi:hypothetical protein